MACTKNGMVQCILPREFEMNYKFVKRGYENSPYQASDMTIVDTLKWWWYAISNLYGWYDMFNVWDNNVYANTYIIIPLELFLRNNGCWRKIYIFDVSNKYKYFVRIYVVMTIPCSDLTIYYENRVFRRNCYPWIIVKILVL